MKTICTGMFTIMLIFLFRPVGAQTEDAFPSYIEQCFNNYFNLLLNGMAHDPLQSALRKAVTAALLCPLI